MPHYTPLIGTIVAGLVTAFIMGALAQRLRISPIAGYLFAGVLIGPFTPGFVADISLANELAEIGVILLMFGVGLHFSLRDLLSVRKIAVPGALVQIVTATLLGLGLSHWMGWPLIAGLIFGLALSVASTVVLLRAIQSRDLVNTDRGRIAVGWLIVEDLAMVVALVLLPPVAQMMEGGGSASGIVVVLGLTVVKVGGFVAFMLIVGRRLIPSGLHWVAHSGSRELFRLAVLAVALGVAFGAAHVFGVSFALGAFFAGMILGETPLSKRAAEETLPLRDAFAVLFFVSVGMLFDPGVIVERPLPLLVTLAIILLGKSLAAYAITRAFGFANRTALTVSISLAQIGEFSFILAGLGTGLGVLPDEARDLILAGAILSIFANPILFTLVSNRIGEGTQPIPSASGVHGKQVERIILVGHGRVGSLLARDLRSADRHMLVIEDQPETAEAASRERYEVIIGNAVNWQVLAEARIESADVLIIAIPEGYEAGAIAETARGMNPAITILARAHSEQEVKHLERLGVDHIIMGEREIARGLFDHMRRRRETD